jgi:hypothetical protein
MAVAYTDCDFGYREIRHLREPVVDEPRSRKPEMVRPAGQNAMGELYIAVAGRERLPDAASDL